MKVELTVKELERRIERHVSDLNSVYATSATKAYAEKMIKRLKDGISMLQNGESSVEVWKHING